MKRKEKKQLKQQEPHSIKRSTGQVKNSRKQIRQNIRNILARSEDVDESLGQFLK